jgi:hypothetical protein
MRTCAFALSVGEDVIWGFGNQVVPGRVNPVFVRVFNDRPASFAGTIHLFAVPNVGGRVGERMAQECYVSPFTERWLQFSVYVGNYWGEWELEWGKGAFDRERLKKPRRGTPARVFLTVADQRGTRGVNIKAFPSDLLPPDVSSLEGLRSVALDAVPRWEPARRMAFLQWIRGGGIVHLLEDADGRYPQFGEHLDVLNRDDDRYHVGSGLIIRHLISRRDLTDEYLADQGFPEPAFQEDGKVVVHDVQSLFFDYLRSQVRAKHPWIAIFVIMIIYIAMVGPGNGYVARKRNTTTWATVCYLGIVVLFSAVFAIMGGYGNKDSASARAVSVARSIGNGTYDVTQWYSVFVTRSGTYDIRHASDHNTYATCDEMHAVNGISRGGLDGVLHLSIPLNSSSTFLHRGVVKIDDFEMRLVEGTGNSNILAGVAFETGKNFPEKVIAMWAYHQGVYYPISREGNRLSVGEPVDGENLVTHKTTSDFIYRRHSNLLRIRADDPDDTRTYADEMARILMARSVNQPDVFRHTATLDTVDPRRVRVFIMTERTSAFAIESNIFKDDKGLVIYEEDLFMESPQAQRI